MTGVPVYLLDKTITVERATSGQNAQGFETETWASHLTGVAARVQPMSAAEALRYGRESTRRMWRVFVAPSNDITELDRVIFTDAAGESHTLNLQEVVDLQEHGAVKRLIGEETR